MMNVITPFAAEFPMAKSWAPGLWVGDQGETSQCVEFAWHHWLQAYPVRPASGQGPYFDQGRLYDLAQELDEWPGKDYDGTSVRAGAKALQTMGFIESYHWAFDIDTILAALLTNGPVVVGTAWYEGMFYPDRLGVVHAVGRFAGGHAYLAIGASRKSGMIKFRNSWGTGWGRRGIFYMPINEFAGLLEDDGEAALAIQRAT
jgi:hypothetical protein